MIDPAVWLKQGSLSQQDFWRLFLFPVLVALAQDPRPCLVRRGLVKEKASPLHLVVLQAET